MHTLLSGRKMDIWLLSFIGFVHQGWGFVMTPPSDACFKSNDLSTTPFTLLSSSYRFIRISLGGVQLHRRHRSFHLHHRHCHDCPLHWCFTASASVIVCSIGTTRGNRRRESLSPGWQGVVWFGLVLFVEVGRKRCVEWLVRWLGSSSLELFVVDWKERDQKRLLLVEWSQGWGFWFLLDN